MNLFVYLLLNIFVLNLFELLFKIEIFGIDFWVKEIWKYIDLKSKFDKYDIYIFVYIFDGWNVC